MGSAHSSSCYKSSASGGDGVERFGGMRKKAPFSAGNSGSQASSAGASGGRAGKKKTYLRAELGLLEKIEIARVMTREKVEAVKKARAAGLKNKQKTKMTESSSAPAFIQ